MHRNKYTFGARTLAKDLVESSRSCKPQNQGGSWLKWSLGGRFLSCNRGNTGNTGADRGNKGSTPGKREIVTRLHQTGIRLNFEAQWSRPATKSLQLDIPGGQHYKEAFVSAPVWSDYRQITNFRKLHFHNNRWLLSEGSAWHQISCSRHVAFVLRGAQHTGDRHGVVGAFAVGHGTLYALHHRQPEGVPGSYADYCFPTEGVTFTSKGPVAFFGSQKNQSTEGGGSVTLTQLSGWDAMIALQTNSVLRASRSRACVMGSELTKPSCL